MNNLGIVINSEYSLAVLFNAKLDQLTFQQKLEWERLKKLIDESSLSNYPCPYEGFSLLCVKKHYSKQEKNTGEVRIFLLQSNKTKECVVLTNESIGKADHTLVKHMKLIQARITTLTKFEYSLAAFSTKPLKNKAKTLFLPVANVNKPKNNKKVQEKIQMLDAQYELLDLNEHFVLTSKNIRFVMEYLLHTYLLAQDKISTQYHDQMFEHFYKLLGKKNLQLHCYKENKQLYVKYKFSVNKWQTMAFDINVNAEKLFFYLLEKINKSLSQQQCDYFVGMNFKLAPNRVLKKLSEANVKIPHDSFLVNHLVVSCIEQIFQGNLDFHRFTDLMTLLIAQGHVCLIEQDSLGEINHYLARVFAVLQIQEKYDNGEFMRILEHLLPILVPRMRPIQYKALLASVFQYNSTITYLLLASAKQLFLDVRLRTFFQWVEQNKQNIQKLETLLHNEYAALTPEEQKCYQVLFSECREACTQTKFGKYIKQVPLSQMRRTRQKERTNTSQLQIAQRCDALKEKIKRMMNEIGKKLEQLNSLDYSKKGDAQVKIYTSNKTDALMSCMEEYLRVINNDEGYVFVKSMLAKSLKTWRGPQGEEHYNLFFFLSQLNNFKGVRRLAEFI